MPTALPFSPPTLALKTIRAAGLSTPDWLIPALVYNTKSFAAWHFSGLDLEPGVGRS